MIYLPSLFLGRLERAIDSPKPFPNEIFCKQLNSDNENKDC